MNKQPITWQHESGLTSRDRVLCQSLDGHGELAKSPSNYQCWVFTQINGTHGVRGGYRGHQNLSYREEFATREEAKAAAEAWLQKKEQDRLIRSIKAGAKLATYSLLLAVGLASAPSPAEAGSGLLDREERAAEAAASLAPLFDIEGYHSARGRDAVRAIAFDLEEVCNEAGYGCPGIVRDLRKCLLIVPEDNLAACTEQARMDAADHLRTNRRKLPKLVAAAKRRGVPESIVDAAYYPDFEGGELPEFLRVHFPGVMDILVPFENPVK